MVHPFMAWRLLLSRLFSGRPVLIAAIAAAMAFSVPASAQQQTPPAQAEPEASADASGGKEVTLEPRPVLLLKGESTWDDGYEALMKAFATLRGEAKRLGLTVVDKPQTAFNETDDQKFKYEAMVFLDKEPPADAAPQGGMSMAKSLAGKAYVFKHVGAYDDIDSVYEAITAWLDEKGLTSKGAFIEEYVNEPQGSDDAKLELNIYVFVQ